MRPSPDASRVPDRDEATPTVAVSRWRSALLHGSLVLFAVTIIGRAAQVQLVDGATWAAQAVEQQVVKTAVTPLRGRVLDATGNVLVQSRELVRLDIVPKNLRDTRRHKDVRNRVRKQLLALGVPSATVKKAMDESRDWVAIRGEFLPSEVEPLVGLPGVWRTRVSRRMPSTSDGLRFIVGDVDDEGVGRGGIEQELDSLLRGTGGTRALLRDPRGAPTETPTLSGTEARPGHSVVLTINQSLQEIAERELSLGMQRTRASGGDIVIVDARDGAILAMAGARGGRAATSTTALTESYEPGSVIKPLLIAHLLDQGRTREDEVIDTEGGRYMLAGRRNPIIDEHKAPSMTVRDVVRHSSNIGAVKLASRLDAASEYQVLRDFGFGVPTGVPFPSEARGFLPRPAVWTAPTASALAMGYEIMASPLQIAAAYGAIASGGELLQPALVREVIDPDGKVIYRHARRPIRRVLTPEGAARMRGILGSVVDSGTATAARLATFDVAGKSGTARRSERGRYTPGDYNSSFAGMFPAQAPQFVFVARLIDPQGTYYGGVVAAPMVNAVLQSAIALRDGSLDRAALAAVAKPVRRTADTSRRTMPRPGAPDDAVRRSVTLGADAANAANAANGGTAPGDASPASVADEPRESALLPGRLVVSLPHIDETTTPPASRTRARRSAPADVRTVPAVAGLDVRRAVFALHSAGFDVRLARGLPGRTTPAAGQSARAGSVVVLEFAR